MQTTTPERRRLFPASALPAPVPRRGACARCTVREAGVVALDEPDEAGRTAFVAGRMREAVAHAVAMVVGPGIVDVEFARRVVEASCDALDEHAGLVLDAFALGALPELGDLVLLGFLARELCDELPLTIAAIG